MSIKPITQRLELTFWSTFIPLMSGSPLLQRMLRECYNLANITDEIVCARPLLSLSLAGLVFGFMIGFMSGLI